MAKAAQRHAHAPYSQKLVGATVLTDSGEMFAGCNVENAANDLGVCAERNAIATAVAAGHSRFVTIIVASPDERLWPPCEQCRPVIGEFSSNPVVIMVSAEGIVRRAQLNSLGQRPFALDCDGDGDGEGDGA